MSTFNITTFFTQQLQLIKTEWSSIQLHSPQARFAFKSALACTLSFVFALMLAIPDPFWAGISAFVVMQAQVGASFQRALHRIFATLTAAFLAVLLVVVFSNSLGFFIALFLVTTFMLYQMSVSKYSYIWLIAALTLLMIDINAFSQPLQVLNIAIYRSIEVVVGSSIAWMVSWLCLPHYAKDQLQQHLLKLIEEFRYSYELEPQHFASHYKKLTLLIDQSKTMLDLTSLESFLYRSKYLFLNRLLLALHAISEVLLDTEQSLTPPQSKHLADNFFNCLIDYLQNRATQKQVMLTLDIWCETAQNQNIAHINLINCIPTLLKDILIEDTQLNASPKFIHINKLARVNAVRGALCLLIIPLIWIFFSLPGIEQIAISVVAILQIDLLETKQKSFSRLLGWVLGATLTMIMFALNITDITSFAIALFLAMFSLSYLHHGSKAALLGTQASLIFIIGAFTNLLPPTSSLELAFNRLSAVLAGTLAIIIITQYLLPITTKQLQSARLNDLKICISHTMLRLFLTKNAPSFLSALLPLKILLKKFEPLTITDDLTIKINADLEKIYHDLFSLNLLLKCFTHHSASFPESFWVSYKSILSSLHQTFLDQSTASTQLQQCKIDCDKIIFSTDRPSIQIEFGTLLKKRFQQLIEDSQKSLIAIHTFQT